MVSPSVHFNQVEQNNTNHIHHIVSNPDSYSGEDDDDA